MHGSGGFVWMMAQAIQLILDGKWWWAWVPFLPLLFIYLLVLFLQQCGPEEEPRSGRRLRPWWKRRKLR